MDKARLLKIRNDAKKRKPRFVVRASAYAARVQERWRYPQGRHSAIRQRHRGRPVVVSTGYGSPTAVRGLHSSGLERVVIHTETELKKLNPALQGAVIGSTVGNKKRLALLTLAEELQVRVLNVKNTKVLQEKIQAAFATRKKVSRERIAAKGRKEEEKKKKAEEKNKKKVQETTTEVSAEEKNIQEEQKREQQKEIVDKTLTKRQ